MRPTVGKKTLINRHQLKNKRNSKKAKEWLSPLKRRQSKNPQKRRHKKNPQSRKKNPTQLKTRSPARVPKTVKNPSQSLLNNKKQS